MENEQLQLNSISPDLRVLEIAERWPETRAVFARVGADLCCGGDKTLAFVAKAHGLDLSALLTELERAAGLSTGQG